MVNLLKIRGRQVQRLVQDLGWFYAVLLGAFLFTVFAQLYHSGKYLSGHPISRLIIVLVVGGLLVSIHFKRPDKVFLALKFKHYYRLYFLEYGLISLPVTLWYLLMGWHYDFILMIGVILTIPFLPVSFSLKSNINERIAVVFTRWLNPRNYVWLAGFRRYWLIMGGLYISSFILLNRPVVSIVLILTLTVIGVPSFYLVFEPLIFIERQKVSPATFLFRKVIRQFGCYMLFLSPFLLGYLSINLQYYFWIITDLTIALLSIIWLNFFKYYVYKHRATPPLSYKYLSLIGILLIPLFPFLFIMMVLKWDKFRTNIDYYIYD